MVGICARLFFSPRLVLPSVLTKCLNRIDDKADRRRGWRRHAALAALRRAASRGERDSIRAGVAAGGRTGLELWFAAARRAAACRSLLGARMVARFVGADRSAGAVFAEKCRESAIAARRAGRRLCVATEKCRLSAGSGEDAPLLMFNRASQGGKRSAKKRRAAHDGAALFVRRSTLFGYLASRKA